MTSCRGFQRSWALKGLPASAGEARRLLRESLADPLYAELLDDAQLAVTEIVTNVALHTDSDLTLTLRAEHGRLCVQISDDSPLLPVERDLGVEAATGRGIALVRQVTSSYGVRALAGGGKSVWFIIGPVEVAGSPWPLLEDPADPARATPAGALPSQAVHVTLDGAAPSLWLTMIAESDARLRELALFQTEYPDGGVTPADLARANLARAQGILAVEQAIASTAPGAVGSVSVRFWVTAEQCTSFARLSTVLAQADQLTASHQLLHPASAPELVALRDWAIDQVRAQVAGQPAQAWDQGRALAEAASARLASTTGGWDAATVSGSDGCAVAFDASERIVAVSQPLAALLGWRSQDLTGRLTSALLPVRLREAHRADIRVFLSTGAAHRLGRSLPLSLLQADGTELPCRVTVTQVGNRVGHPVFLTQITPVVEPVHGQVVQAAEGHPGRALHADLSRFTLGDMTRMAAAIRRLGEGASSTQNFATTLCRYLYDQFRDEAGLRQTALVRLYSTLPLDELPDPDQALAHRSHPGGLAADTTCLALLATAGDQPGWNDRTAAAHRQVLPLTDPAQFAALPVMNALMAQVGLEPSAVLSRWHPSGSPGRGTRQRIFHVAQQTLEPGHPAYRFSQKHHLQSLVGFGGALPGGGLFGVMVFTRVLLQPEAARMFQLLAHSATYGCFVRAGVPVFQDGPRTDRPGSSLSACQRAVSQTDLLVKLLRDYERITAAESDATARALERSRFDAQRYASLARTLQVVLLPQALPVIPGLQTGALFRPAGDGSEIGGDFYDLFALSANRFGLVLGDVSGKGAEAAVLTALARQTIRAAAVVATDACQVLRALDLAISDDDPDSRYLTALFGFATVETGVVTLQLALGGHPRPFVLRADGTVEAVGVEGGALGLFPDPGFTEVDVVLRSGDAFVAYSDGVTDGRRGDEEFGEARLRAVLSDQCGQSASSIAANLGTLLVDFQRGITHDDVALVVLRCE